MPDPHLRDRLGLRHLFSRSRSPADARAPPVQPCAPAANTQSGKLLDKALGLLKERERAIIRENILPNTNDIGSALEDVLKAAQKKQKICDGKRWTFTIRGHPVMLREEADKVIMWLDRSKAVGDIAGNVDPIHAGLPWAGIRLLLEV
jgi:hypothetical protein